MFLAHLPAGYLISRALVRRSQQTRIQWTLAAGMAGGVFPDIDLLYLHLLDATPQHHHTYWTHLPIAWLGCAALTWIAVRGRSVALRQALAAFLLAWLSHLLLDTVTGDIWWLYPLIDQPYSQVKIEAHYQPWWMNFLLHRSMALELAIITAAVWLEKKKPLLHWRIKLPKPIALAGMVFIGLMLVESYLSTPTLQQPVLGASAKDWNSDSFWHPHWGQSGVHKGIDIFATRGTPVMSTQSGLVIFRGSLEQGGKAIVVLSPRGWMHYYAHLDSTQTRPGAWVTAGESIGRVGTTGNSANKPPHLHYSILSPVPRLSDYRPVKQGGKRMFYRDPGRFMVRTSTPGSPGTRLGFDMPDGPTG